MQNLAAKINEIVDEQIDMFCGVVATTFHLDKDELLALWNKNDPNGAAALKRSKRSPYQLFFSKKRLELKELHPDLSFGDLSRQISKLWKSMSKDQQMQSIGADETDVLDVPPLPKKVPPRKRHGKKQSDGGMVTGTTDPKSIVADDHPLHITENVPERRAAIEIQPEEGKRDDDDVSDEEDFDFDDDDAGNAGDSLSDDDFDDGDSIV